MGSAGDGDYVVPADPGPEARESGVRDDPAGFGDAADQPGPDPCGRGIGEGRETAIPIAVLEQDGQDGIGIELGEAERLGPDVPVGPARVRGFDRGDGRLERGIWPLEWVAG